MPSKLNDVRNSIRAINIEAEKAAMLFKELDRITTTMTLGALAGEKGAVKYREATQELVRLNTALKETARLQAQTRGGMLPRVGAVTPGTTGGGLPDTGDQERAKNEAMWLRQRQRLYMESFGASSQSMQKAQRMLQRYGLSLNHLSKVYVEPISRTREFTFANRDANGVMQKATLAVDRFGNVIGSSGTKFRSFEDMITRNIGKVLEWAIAVGVVYGAFSQLGQAVSFLREIDEEMANIAIATGEAGDNLTRFFDEAVEAARLTGTTLDGVLSIYDDAIKSTSSIADETVRYETANKLLTNSLMLSRLTGMDQAAAMDMLVGSLRQIGPLAEDIAKGMDKTAATFARGSDVLDIWAYAAKGAFTNMQDLGETFAITGAAAASAGMDVASLTASATVLAESTRKSATEVGNTMRRMILTMQAETGQQALMDYGIAFEDLSGQARSFDDIMGELAAKYRAGVLTEGAIREIGYALGGGARGGADVQLFIKNYDQVINKTEQLRDKNRVAGAAADQLETKMNTLNTAINALNVGFQDLVQTIGAEGGFLELLTTIVKALDGIVQVFGDVTEAIGPATTRMLVFATAMAAVMRYSGRARGLLGYMPPGPVGTGLPGFVGGQALTPQTQPYMSGAGALRANTGGLAAAGIYAGAAALSGEGDMKERVIRAGSIMAGAVVGTLTGAGPMIGALIGDAAGSAMLGFVEDMKLRASDITTMSDADLRKLQGNLYDEIARTGQPGGLLDIWFGDDAKIKAKTDKMISLFKEGREEEAFAGLPGMRVGGEAQAGFYRDLFQDYLDAQEQLKERGLPDEQAADRLKELEKERYAEIAKYNDLAARNTEASAKKRQEFLKQTFTGDKTRKEYKDFAAGQADALNKTGALYRELKDDIGGSVMEMQDTLARMTQETRDELMSVVTTMGVLEDKIASTADAAEKADYTAGLEEHRDLLVEIYKLAEKSVGAGDPFQFKGFTDYSDYTQEEMDEIMAKAYELQEVYFETLGIDEEIWKESLETWVMMTKAGFEEVEDLYQAFPQLIKKAMDDAKKEQDTFNLQRLKDFDPSKFGELQKRVRYWETALARVPGYSEQAETQPFNLVLGENNELRRLMTTQEALRFAIEDLTDVEKKQLEGMWNIPEGATVMVPLQSLYYAPKTPGGELQVPETPGEIFGAGAGGDLLSGFDMPASKMDTAGDKMLTASQTMADIGRIVYDVAGPAEKKPIWEREQSMADIGGIIYGKGGSYEPEYLKDQDRPLMEFLGGIKEAIQSIELKLPPIDANINITIPAIRLDGKQVSESMTVTRTQRLSSAARARGMLGGGVIE